MLLLKKLTLVFTLIGILSASAIVWATITNTLLVFDMQNNAELPKKFRTSLDVLSYTGTINNSGFANLSIAGSAQFSESGLQKVLQKLNTGEVTIIDLRQEAHGLIDGNAISWYAPHNAGNAGKTAEQIEANQAKRLARINKAKRVKIYTILEKTTDEVISKTKSQVLPVRDVMTEAQLARKYHLDYRRIYVEDFHAPVDREVDRFIRIVKELPQGKWIYFHCRAGIGRTSTLMAMYDMMRNSKQVSFDDILARQNAIGGKNLVALPEEGRYKYKLAIERLEFLRKFYEYTRVNNDGFKTMWSGWKKVAKK